MATTAEARPAFGRLGLDVTAVLAAFALQMAAIAVILTNWFAVASEVARDLAMRGGGVSFAWRFNVGHVRQQIAVDAIFVAADVAAAIVLVRFARRAEAPTGPARTLLWLVAGFYALCAPLILIAGAEALGDHPYYLSQATGWTLFIATAAVPVFIVRILRRRGLVRASLPPAVHVDR